MTTYANLADAQTAYLANLDYADDTGSVSKARDFRSACTALLVLLPQFQVQDGRTRSVNMGNVSAQLKMVNTWLSSKDGAARVTFANFQEFRS